MNKHSIITHITIFFVLLLLILDILLFTQYRLSSNAQKVMQFERYGKLMHITRENSNIERELSFLDCALASVTPKDLENADKKYKIGPFDVYEFNDKKYIHLMPPPPPPHTQNFNDILRKPRFELKDMIIEDHYNYSSFNDFLVIFAIILNILLIRFYIFLVNKLKPLKQLNEDINKFANGNLDFSTAREGKDEISQVANTFDKALTKIRDLTKSRNLFLRNIMHEFKTPITKAMITIEMLENTKNKERLYRVFERLDYLLGEFAKVELLTSSELKLNKQNFKLIESVYQAFDYLMIDETIVTIQDNGTNAKIDFELFSVALKNLIDNAIKYGSSKPILTITPSSIIIQNIGKELSENERNFENMFNRKYESSQNGLGLGLYISYAIVKAHEYKFTYYYKNDTNFFEINFVK